MIVALIVLGAILANVILAYVPIILIVGYNLRPRPPKNELDELVDAYVLHDAMSTEEFVTTLEQRFDDMGHAPLEVSK